MSKADNTEASKKQTAELWVEIRRMYESASKPKYEKIRSILMLEFDLSSFPAKRTMERRAASEGWVRSAVGDDPKANRFPEELWMCIKSVYESYPKLTYKRLKELVENELQCIVFPSAQAINARATQEDWQNLKTLLDRSDASLKKLSKDVKKLDITGSYIESGGAKKTYNNEQHGSYEDIEPQPDPAFIQEQVNSEFSRIGNLLMTSNQKRQKMADVIVKSRKRMATMNAMGDVINDTLIKIFVLQMSDEIRQNCGTEFLEQLESKKKNLSHLATIFNELSFSRRESAKFELSLYGVQIEDLKDDEGDGRIKSLNDESAFEAQKIALQKQKEEAAATRAWIESGGLDQLANDTMQQRMAEAAEDIDFEECEE